MTDEQFQFQMKRLESAFGEKHFDLERLDLIKQSVFWMELGQFSSVVDHFISSFRQAPLPKDFKEAAIHERNKMPNIQKEKDIFAKNFSSDGLKKTLALNYPGCKTLADAIRYEREKIKLKNSMG